MMSLLFGIFVENERRLHINCIPIYTAGSQGARRGAERVTLSSRCEQRLMSCIRLTAAVVAIPVSL
jgi:hypothetical protein